MEFYSGAVSYTEAQNMPVTELIRLSEIKDMIEKERKKKSNGF